MTTDTSTFGRLLSEMLPLTAAPRERPEPQFLVWGGESDGFVVLTANEIARGIEASHYSGDSPWEKVAYIDPAGPSLSPVDFRWAPQKAIGSDYLQSEITLVRSSDKVSVGTFTVTIDGRA